jgi:hypothetical protein
MQMDGDESSNIEDRRSEGGFGGGGFGGGAEAREKRETINKEAKEKIYTVLTVDQRKAWRNIVGEELKLEPFGGFGGGFGGFKGKGGKGKGDNKKKDETK